MSLSLAGQRLRRPWRTAAAAAFAALTLGLTGRADVGPETVDPDALRGAVLAQLRLGDLQSALRAAERWVSLPQLTDAARAEALIREAGVRALLGDSAGAASDYERALALMPGDPDASLGAALALRDHPDLALPHAEQAARSAATAGRRAAAQRLAAEILLDLGEADKARAGVERALKLAPDDLYALQDMARIMSGRPKEAARFAERGFRAAEAAPRWCRPEAYRLSARIWLELKDSTGAAKSLRRALAVDPDDVDAWEALVLIKRGDPGAAAAAAGPETPPAADGARPEAELLRALKSDPGDLEALRRLVALRRAQERAPEAAAYAERFADAVLDAPSWQQAAAYRLSARTWLELGQNELARQSFWKARDMDTRSLAIAQLGLEMKLSGPTTLDALGNVVRARAEVEDGSLPQYDFPQTHEYGPGDVAALRKAVQTMLVQGRTNEALTYAERLVALTPKDPAAHAAAYRLKALVRHELHDETGVQEDFRRALGAAPAI
ncbi:MAG: hypothetical protein ACHQ51_12660 [Elusimicrobiota bacterium]